MIVDVVSRHYLCFGFKAFFSLPLSKSKERGEILQIAHKIERLGNSSDQVLSFILLQTSYLRENFII